MKKVDDNRKVELTDVEEDIIEEMDELDLIWTHEMATSFVLDAAAQRGEVVQEDFVLWATGRAMAMNL